MELNQVLHFYLGCEVQIAQRRMSTDGMIDNTRVGVFRGYWDNERRHARIQFRTGPEGHVDLLFFKPLLRKLSSMTEEEGKAVFTIEKDRVLHETILDFDLSKRDHGLVIHRLDDLNVSMMMGFDGVCYKVVQDFSRKTIEPALNQPLIFAYLLKQRFDLFGLIESKQAIDINAKTEQQ